VGDVAVRAVTVALTVDAQGSGGDDVERESVERRHASARAGNALADARRGSSVR
jgi:hypothetical protein